MHIERMHKMQECLTEKAVSEFEKGIENVDTSEMGQVVDMIKDLAEAEYHSIISKAMKKADEEEEEYNYIFRHCKRLVLRLIIAHSIKSTLTRLKVLKTSNTRL